MSKSKLAFTLLLAVVVVAMVSCKSTERCPAYGKSPKATETARY